MVFINDLDNGIEGSLIKFVDDTKLEGIANTLEDKLKSQKDLYRFEHWTLSEQQFSAEKNIVFFLHKHRCKEGIKLSS